jgi:anti-anti-sigma factor
MTTVLGKQPQSRPAPLADGWTTGARRGAGGDAVLVLGDDDEASHHPAHVALSGEIDAASVASVRTAFTHVAAQQHVVLDLSKVTFIDSSGLGAIIGGLRRVREAGGRAVITGASRSIDRMLVTTGVIRLVPVAPTVEDALALLDDA